MGDADKDYEDIKELKDAIKFLERELNYYESEEYIERRKWHQDSMENMKTTKNYMGYIRFTVTIEAISLVFLMAVIAFKMF